MYVVTPSMQHTKNNSKLICWEGAYHQPVAWGRGSGDCQDIFRFDEYKCGHSLRDVHKVNLHQLVKGRDSRQPSN